MRFENLNWFDIEEYLEQDDRLMIILGACEQHAYLSLLTDVKIPQALADAATQKTGVLVAPPINFGISPYFLAYPGTISLRATTLMDIVEDMVRSVYRQGFRRLLVLNGHGGNIPAKSRLHELTNELSGLRTIWYSWWQSDSVITVAHNFNLPQSHANWQEAFKFTRIVEMPEENKLIVKTDEILEANKFREEFGDGSFGGPYLAPDEVMESIFNAALKDILKLLNFGEIG